MVKKVLKVLARETRETHVEAVALKNKTSFKSNYLLETVRPNVILRALECLKSCPVYQEARVSIYYNRLTDPSFILRESRQQGDDHALKQLEDSYSEEDDPQPWNVPDNETFLFSEAIVLAPVENYKPLPLFLDTYAKSISFIKLNAGQLIIIPKHLSYQNWVKSEIMCSGRQVVSFNGTRPSCSDRRLACVSKLFYSSLKLRAQKIASIIGFCLRKTKGIKSFSVQQALSDILLTNFLSTIVDMNCFPQTGSPAFWEEKKKEVFAMLRQLGPPTFFITLSPAETRWPELLVILKKVMDNENISVADAAEMAFEEKVRLIKEDTVTSARYFDYRLRRFFFFK